MVLIWIASLNLYLVFALSSRFYFVLKRLLNTPVLYVFYVSAHVPYTIIEYVFFYENFAVWHQSRKNENNEFVVGEAKTS